MGRQSADAKRRYDRQTVIARDMPDSNYDISDCELEELPSIVYTLCQLLKKETLIAHTNSIEGLDKKRMKNLVTLRTLDLAENEIVKLPDQISLLVNLQVLDLSRNFLKALPEPLSSLTQLKVLKLRSNKLKALPSGLEQWRRLQLLDVRENRLTRLPKSLARLQQSLTELLFDNDKVTFPPKSVDANTGRVMEYLCGELGIPYTGPCGDAPHTDGNSNSQPLDTTDSLTAADSRGVPHSSSWNADLLERQVAETVRAREELRARQLAERTAHFRSLETVNQQLLADKESQRQELISGLQADQRRLERQVQEMMRMRDGDRQRLREQLTADERQTEQLIERILAVNTQRDAVLTRQLEQDRELLMSQSRSVQLRRDEVLAAMRQTLAAADGRDVSRVHGYLERKDSGLTSSGRPVPGGVDQATLDRILADRDMERQGVVNSLLEQERMQREAFEMLQLSRDSAHVRLCDEIAQVEQKLVELTLQELDRRGCELDTNRNILVEQRERLSELLQGLMAQQKGREDEVRRLLSDMEQMNKDKQTDYWLVQYQRLMDSRPDVLADNQVDSQILQLLAGTPGLDRYLPYFARHSLTYKQLLFATDDSLRDIGVGDSSDRATILALVEDANTAEKKGHTLGQPFKSAEPSAPPVSPSAPPISGAFAAATTTTTADSAAAVAQVCSAECAVCMERRADSLFMPCGHVGCCTVCAARLDKCPLCQAWISNKIRLFFS